MTTRAQKAFLLDLAQVLERHNVAMTSTKDIGEITFTRNSLSFIKTQLGRSHLTQYDLRELAGMGIIDANEMYQIMKRLNDR